MPAYPPRKTLFREPGPTMGQVDAMPDDERRDFWAALYRRFVEPNTHALQDETQADYYDARADGEWAR